MKYGNIPTIYNGRKYDSRKEAGYAKLLDTLKHAKDPKDRVHYWEPQLKLRIEVEGEHICDYIADFFVEYANGRREYIDVKGGEATKTAVYKIKKKLVKALYDIDIVEV